MFEERLATISAKLKSCDPQIVWHGELALGPHATLKQIRAFEAEQNVRLPLDYQEFIQIIGDGIYNPWDFQFHYLQSLFSQNDPHTFHPHSHLLNDLHPNHPLCFGLIPFPLEWNQIRYGYIELSSWDDLSFHEKMEHDLAVAIHYHPDGTMRCLVLTGDERGVVWRGDENTQTSKRFVDAITGEPLSFLDWFEARLDHALSYSGTYIFTEL